MCFSTKYSCVLRLKPSANYLLFKAPYMDGDPLQCIVII